MGKHSDHIWWHRSSCHVDFVICFNHKTPIPDCRAHCMCHGNPLQTGPHPSITSMSPGLNEYICHQIWYIYSYPKLQWINKIVECTAPSEAMHYIGNLFKSNSNRCQMGLSNVITIWFSFDAPQCIRTSMEVHWMCGWAYLFIYVLIYTTYKYLHAPNAMGNR